MIFCELLLRFGPFREHRKPEYENEHRFPVSDDQKSDKACPEIRFLKVIAPHSLIRRTSSHRLNSRSAATVALSKIRDLSVQAFLAMGRFEKVRVPDISKPTQHLNASW
jgi:hypothetical protein